jgi:FkbM family methyltransferase
LYEAAYRLIGKAYIEVMMLRHIVRRGDTVIDVGASIGPYTSLMASLVGSRGRVHAFEPLPSSFRALVANVTTNGLADRVRFNQVALGDVPGKLEIFVPDGNFYEASLVVHRQSLHKQVQGPHQRSSWIDPASIEAYRSEVTTLDAYTAEHHVGEVSFLKCDVEGAELTVFRGARRLLCRPTPPMLMFEVYAPWTADFGYAPADLFEFLRGQAGYVFYHCGRTGVVPVDSESGIQGNFPHFLNFLAFVPEVHWARLESLLPRITREP